MHKVEYTCPMHPEVVMDKPGKCPKCGMTLVEKKDMKKNKMEKMEKKDSMKNTSKKEEMKTKKM